MKKSFVLLAVILTALFCVSAAPAQSYYYSGGSGYLSPPVIQYDAFGNPLIVPPAPVPYYQPYYAPYYAPYYSPYFNGGYVAPFYSSFGFRRSFFVPSTTIRFRGRDTLILR
jgi:hypothetical protein